MDRVVGLDVDDAVRDNPNLDEAHVITQGVPVPTPDGVVDLVVSDFTFEHVGDPAWASREQRDTFPTAYRLKASAT